MEGERDLPGKKMALYPVYRKPRGKRRISFRFQERAAAAAGDLGVVFMPVF